MKSIKYILLGLVAAFSVVSSSKAIIYTLTTNYSKLTIAITVTQNGTNITKNNVTKHTVTNTKITNKELLALFAQWDGTTWPTGAQLVEGWDYPWKGDVLVVDKSGTNVLYDATKWNSPDQYFYIDFFDEEGAYTESIKDGNPGFYNYIWGNVGYFQLYDDVNTNFISATGPCTENFSQKYDKNGIASWSDTQTFSASGSSYYSDSEELNGNSTPTTINADISAKGKGSGVNYIYILYEEF